MRLLIALFFFVFFFFLVVLLHPAAHEADVSDFWAVRYGDGSEIPDEDIVAAKKIMDESG